MCTEILRQEKYKEKAPVVNQESDLTPSLIKSKLDEYVIGQDTAKKTQVHG